jgi:hypothetical protein
MLKAVPAVAFEGADTARWVAAAAKTNIELLVPVIEEFTVSVALTVWLRAVRSVALNVPTPFVKVLSAGSEKLPSVVVTCTWPS